MSICYPYVIPAPVAGYQGPGDIVSGAVSWWGLRAYSAAKAATAPYAGIRISSDPADSGVNATDINILSTGSLDVAAVEAYIVAHTAAYVVTFYDQVGAANFVQAGTEVQLIVSPSGLTAGRVAIRQTINGVYVATITAAAQPITLSSVAMNTGASTDEGWIFANGAANFAATYNGAGGGAGGAANVVGMHSNTRVTATATDGAWHAVQRVFNGASSGINVDATPSSALDAGTNAIGTASDCQAFSAFGQDWRGDSVEMGVWANKAFSDTESSNMSANQKAYWGYA